MKQHKKIKIVTLLIGGVIFLRGGVVAVPTQASGEVRMAGYTTYYDQKVAGRSENIRLAASLIDGFILQAYGEFSFNQTVGERSEKRGFQKANVIVGGEYVQGVGGGVCQVSTTLYNAALCAGLTIAEYHPHSLAVGYVPPSQDAMVSSLCDLKLFNPYEFAVTLSISAKEGAIKARILGKKTGKRREIVSKVLEHTPPPSPLEVEAEKEGILREEKWGLKSESYIEIYQNEALIGRKRLRSDSYAPTRGIILKKSL